MSPFAALTPLRAKLAEAQEDLADDLLMRLDQFTVDAIATVALADEAEAWLTTRLIALDAVRTDELSRRFTDRDHDWLQASLEARFQARSLLGMVRLSRAKLERAA